MNKKCSQDRSTNHKVIHSENSSSSVEDNRNAQPGLSEGYVSVAVQTTGNETEEYAPLPHPRTEPMVQDVNSTDAITSSQEELAYPLILVAAQDQPTMKDAQVGTNSRSRRRSLRPAAEASSSGRTQEVKSISSDNYDQDEPLTTKAIKIYKKRPTKPNPAPDDSEDSLENMQLKHNRRKFAEFNRPLAVDSDAPLSETSGMRTVSDSSSIRYSSSGTLEFDDTELSKHDFMPGNLPPGFKLNSGAAFIYMAIPPDGGYGWLVLLLSFLAQLIVDGIIFSIGILLPSMGAEFGESTASVVLVGSIQIGCYFMGGAFSSALINSYGFRPVALIGVAISGLAILGASFSPNLVVMILCYSMIGGPGLSMIWVSSQLIIGYYFERYRPIASGFSCSGAGAGIVLFSLTNSKLVNTIGWRNIMRIQVVLIFVVFFMGLAYLEVSPTPVAFLQNKAYLSSSSSNEYYGNFYVHNFLGEELTSAKSHTGLENYEPPRRQRCMRRWASRCMPCCFRKKKVYYSSGSDRSDRNFVVRPDPIQREDLFYTGPVDYDVPHREEQFDGKQLELVGTETHLQRTAYALHNIHDYDSTDAEDEIDLRPSMRFPLTGPHSPSSKRKKQGKTKKRHWLKTKVMKALNRLLDVHLLKNFEFRVLLTAAFLYPMGLNIPFMYSKARTTIPLKYAQLISPSIGATNFIVRILCGFAAYKLRNWTDYICGGGMVIGGAMVFISAFYGENLIWFQFVYGLTYGIAPAVFATLRALIYVRYMGLSKLTNAFGITALAMGLGVFIGTTFGGFLIYKTDGYMAPFAFSGLCITCAGSLKLILPTWTKHRRNHKKT